MSEALLAVLPDPGLLVRADGEIVSANPAAADLLGTSRDSLKGRSLFDLVNDPEPAVRRFLEIASRSRPSVPGALAWKLANGTALEMRCDGALVEPAAGGGRALVYLRCQPKLESLARFERLDEQIRELSRKIRERRTADAALRRSEERYRTLIASTSSVVFTADPSGAFVEPQPSLEAFTGQSPGEYGNFAEMTAIHPDDRAAVREDWLRSMAAGAPFESDLRLWHGPSQSYRACIARAVPVRGADGTVREWVGTVADVEDRKRLEEQLRQTQKLEGLGVLAGGVAHDFNNLLVGILGNASLALESLSPTDPAAPMLRDVVGAGETAAHLTSQLLAYAGKGRFVIEPVDMSDLVRQISTLIQASIPKTVRISLELKDGLPAVEADASQLQQLVMNLVINGGEAIPEGRPGTVMVTTGEQDIDEEYIQTALAPAEIEPGRYVTLEVQDSGIGMTPETIARIFDPFFSTKFTGRGLGLAAVLGIVRGHNGAIKVYSTPGQGTNFKVLLPAAVAAVPARVEEEPEGERRGSGTVLVIDDEDVVRRAAKSMLESRGYDVVLAENGQEGLELFKRLGEDVSAVLLDMTMPVMSGEETLRRVKEIRPDVPVVLSSGYSEMEAVRRFAGQDLAGFVQKPYSGVALEKAVRSAIERRTGRLQGGG